MNLPIEIIKNILEYDNKIKYRNGRFMNQLQIDNDISTMLDNIPKKHKYFTEMRSIYWNSFVELFANSGRKKFILEYNNYLSNYDHNGKLVQNNITFSFITKSVLNKRIERFTG
jgi:hypothetical protein